MKKPLMTFLFDYFKPLYIDVFWFQKKQPKTAIYNHGIQYIYIHNKSYIATRSHRSGDAAQGILAWTVPAPSLTSLTLAKRLVPSRWVRTSSASPSDVCAPMLPSRSWLVVGGAEMFENLGSSFWNLIGFNKKIPSSWIMDGYSSYGLWMVIVLYSYIL